MFLITVQLLDALNAPNRVKYTLLLIYDKYFDGTLAIVDISLFSLSAL